MTKYSFIVPVYNTSKYLKRCLDSLIGQKFESYEIIIVNDGSTDNSEDIIKCYLNKYKKIKYIKQRNKGLSEARNVGVKHAKGEYLLFVDSDDYVEKSLLKEVDKKISNVNLLRFQVIKEDETGKHKETHEEKAFGVVSGKDAFKFISEYHFVEPAWCYVYEKEFYLKNKFEFKKGVYHEDFGLIPEIIYKAKSVKSINYLGYHYVVREGSIMTDGDYKKTVKKAFDMLEQYKNLKSLLKTSSKNNYDDYYLSYISNCVIVKARELNKDDKKKYVSELKNLNAFDGVLVDTFARKIKKVLMKISLNLYLKVVK